MWKRGFRCVGGVREQCIVPFIDHRGTLSMPCLVQSILYARRLVMTRALHSALDRSQRLRASEDDVNHVHASTGPQMSTVLRWLGRGFFWILCLWGVCYAVLFQLFHILSRYIGFDAQYYCLRFFRTICRTDGRQTGICSDKHRAPTHGCAHDLHN
jgi:hypothetical protein